MYGSAGQYRVRQRITHPSRARCALPAPTAPSTARAARASQLPRCQVLQVENNRIELLPESLGELPSVIKMDLSTNNLRYLPASMGQLKKVQRIDVGNNLLTKVCWGGGGGLFIPETRSEATKRRGGTSPIKPYPMQKREVC